MDTCHLTALELNLFNERRRAATAKTGAERDLRTVWVGQLEKEIKQERALLGLPSEEAAPAISDDELLAELNALGG